MHDPTRLIQAHEIFDIYGVGPVASASLGQVYKARVRSTNELVAIKVGD